MLRRFNPHEAPDLSRNMGPPSPSNRRKEIAGNADPLRPAALRQVQSCRVREGAASSSGLISRNVRQRLAGHQNRSAAGSWVGYPIPGHQARKALSTRLSDWRDSLDQGLEAIPQGGKGAAMENLESIGGSMSEIDDAKRAEDCIEYRENMDTPMETLAMVLGNLGFDREGLMDHELIDVVARKLKTLHALVLAGGMKPEMLKAIMGE